LVERAHEGVDTARFFGVQHGLATGGAKIAAHGRQGGGLMFVGVGRVSGVVHQLSCAAGGAFHFRFIHFAAMHKAAPLRQPTASAKT
jgi:hypothetical protein